MMRHSINFIAIFLGNLGFLFSQQQHINTLHRESFCNITFEVSTDSHYLARLSYNAQTIYLYDLIDDNKKRIIYSFPNGSTTSMAFSPKGDKIATSGLSGIVNIYKTDQNKLLGSFNLTDVVIKKVIFITNNECIAIGNDSNIYHIDILTGSVYSLKTDEKIFRDVVFDKKNDQLYLISNNLIKVFKGQELVELGKYQVGTNILTAIGVDEDFIYVGDIKGYLHVLNKSNMNHLKRIKQHKSLIASLSVYNGNILTGSYDSTVKLYNTQNGQTETLANESDYILKVKLIDEASFIYSSCNGVFKWKELNK